MKKSLLATVAAVALIAGAGMASAENAKDQPGVKAGGAAAVKAEPEMKKGPDIKAGAEVKGKHETTGAGTEMKAEPKAEMKAEPKADAKSGSKAEIKPDSKAKATTTGAGESKSSAEPKAAADTKAGAPAADTKSNAAAADTKGGTGASVSLTTEQKSKIRTTVLQSSSAPKVSRSSINFNISVGTVVPRSVHFVSVPSTLVEIYPSWRGYEYFVVDEEIIIIDPRTLRIVAVLNV